jgi:hypothetical protein
MSWDEKILRGVLKESKESLVVVFVGSSGRRG